MSTCETNTEIIARKKVSFKGRPKGMGRKKIEIKEREDEQPRMVTFSKRRQGLYRKTYQFNSLTGYTFAIFVLSPKGRLYKHGNPSFDEVFGNYIKENEAENKLERYDNELVSWLGAILLEEYDDVNKLVMLKEKLLELKEKARTKIDGDIH